MSIEMGNPKTVMEKVDAASNHVSGMMLAHMTKNEEMFTEKHEKVSKLLFDVMQMLEEAS